MNQYICVYGCRVFLVCYRRMDTATMAMRERERLRAPDRENPAMPVPANSRGSPERSPRVRHPTARYRDEHPVRVQADGGDLPPTSSTSTERAPRAGSVAERPTPTRVLPTRRARPTQFHVEHVVCPAYHDVAQVHALRARALDFLHPSAKEGVI